MGMNKKELINEIFASIDILPLLNQKKIHLLLGRKIKANQKKLPYDRIGEVS